MPEVRDGNDQGIIVSFKEDITVPRGDGTGPMGMGAMTGRGAGYCAGFGVPGYANSVPGRDFGMGFGKGCGAMRRGFGSAGRGRRNMFHATGLPGWKRSGGAAAPYGYQTPYQKPNPEMEKQVLENRAEALQAELEAIKKHLAEVETAAGAK
jgi:hypothetical protein